MGEQMRPNTVQDGRKVEQRQRQQRQQQQKILRWSPSARRPDGKRRGSGRSRRVAGSRPDLSCLWDSKLVKKILLIYPTLKKQKHKYY